jgi:hypothetical protein
MLHQCKEQVDLGIHIPSSLPVMSANSFELMCCEFGGSSIFRMQIQKPKDEHRLPLWFLDTPLPKALGEDLRR